MKYPGLLDEDVSRIGVQESQMLNLISGKLVTDLVKTSLGPKGMSKIYIDILDEDTLTKHGGAFLRKVDVDHPAAKSVIEAVNTVDTHVGDGTTSSAILIGSLLDNAKDLVEIPDHVKKGLKIHPVKFVDEVFAIALKTKPVKSKAAKKVSSESSKKAKTPGKALPH